ncbi:MAG TPA: DUF488 domain-containing protein [Chitinophagaceae bacterium]|nr:DUF488 domain-containing protein [Chitinophagaceae bacterium]
MMYYRRKIILSLLQIFDGELDKIRLQKLLFLFTQRQKKAEYDFIPYKFGCYSYSANADLKVMITKGFLQEDDSLLKKVDTSDYLAGLKNDDKNVLLEVKRLYGHMTAEALMLHTYINYPYWAINSIRARDVLPPVEYDKLDKYKPKVDETIMFTIGYEGISLEEYLNRLIKNDIKILIDVRSNPVSMKYGFSKNQLKQYCQNIGIKYLHFPELGIQSDLRRNLNSQADYNSLFEDYKTNNLKKTTELQKNVLNILKESNRIALTCFEANICQCHRKSLSESIQALPEFNYRIKHI